MAEEGGWDFPELRRLLTHGYCADAVWGLLTSLPPDLRALLRAALRAAGAPPSAQVEGGYTWPTPLAAAESGGRGCWEEDLTTRAFHDIDEQVRTELQAEAPDDVNEGGVGGVGFFEAEYDAATQRRGAVRLSERYVTLLHCAFGGRAALLAMYQEYEVPLPMPELDFLAVVVDDLLRRTAGDIIQYHRVVRPPPVVMARGVPRAAAASAVHRRPPEAALVCVLSRARFDAGGRVTRVSGPLRLLASSGCRAAVAVAMLRGRAGLESNGEDGRRCRFSPAKSCRSERLNTRFALVRKRGPE